MLQRFLQRCHVVASFPLRLCDGLKGDALAVVLQILIEQHGVIPFLLRLYPVPVLKAVQSDGGVVVGKVQIQIGGVELLVDLLVEQLRYVSVHRAPPSVLFSSCSLQSGQIYRILRSYERISRPSACSIRLCISGR